ncbi:MAG: hypothetical protein WC699_13500 [Bacteroidales bacterium]|jgi:opacity protein-like surface antigen
MAIKNKILKLILLISLVLTSTAMQAQQVDISIRAFPSSWYNSYYEPGLDGMGFAVTYHPLLSKVLRLNVSGEYSILKSRSEAFLGFGINKTIWQAEHFRISAEANILNGVGMYKPLPLYVGGIEGVARFDYYVGRRVSLFAGIGARATLCPGYRDFGVWKHSSWPVMMGIRF